MKFYALCPVCTRKIYAETRFMLDENVNKHVTACAARKEKALRRELIERRQGTLFGGGS